MHYHDALSLYENRVWKDAKTAFENVQPDSDLYVKRCDEFIVKPGGMVFTV